MLFEMKIQVVKSLCVKLYDVEDYLAGLLHALEREVFHLSVEVVTAGKYVRTWESHE